MFRVREIFYSRKARRNLGELRSTEAEERSIHEQMLQIAQELKGGFLLPAQSAFLSREEKLYRYDVGRFALNYKMDGRSLEVVSVMV